MMNYEDYLFVQQMYDGSNWVKLNCHDGHNHVEYQSNWPCLRVLSFYSFTFIAFYAMTHVSARHDQSLINTDLVAPLMLFFAYFCSLSGSWKRIQILIFFFKNTPSLSDPALFISYSPERGRIHLYFVNKKLFSVLSKLISNETMKTNIIQDASFIIDVIKLLSELKIHFLLRKNFLSHGT